MILWSLHAARAADEPAEEDDQTEVVVITGTRTERPVDEAPVAVEVIDRAAIVASGSWDLADLLEQQAGVDIERSFLGSGIRLRGLEPQHTLLLIDGVRVVGQKDGTYDLSRLNLDAVERVEIVKGAASSLYGSDAMGGVVQIVTRKAQDPWSGDLAARGAFPIGADASAGVATRGQAGGLRIDAGYHQTSGWDDAPADPATNGNDLRQLDGALAADTKVSPVTTLTARGSWSGIDARGVDLGSAGAVLDRRNLTEDGLLSAGIESKPGERTKLRANVGGSLFRDQYASDQRRAGALDDYQETREDRWQLDAQVDMDAGWHGTTFGVEADLANLRSERLEGGQGTRTTGALYGQDEILVSRTPRVALVPGLRGDVDSWFGGAAAPSAALRWDPHEDWVVRSSAATGWRAPSFRELLLSFDNPSVGYRVQGNPDLRPERSLSSQVGLEWSVSDIVTTSISGHVDRVSDLIQIGTLSESPGLVRYGYVNVDDALTRGFDGTFGVAGRRVGLDVSAQFLDARDLGTGRALEGRAAWRGTVAPRMKLGSGTSGTVRAMVVGERPFFPGTGRVDAPPYGLVDARVSQELDRRLSLAIGCDNVFDVGDGQYLTTPPRLFYAGLDASLAPPPTRRRP